MLWITRDDVMLVSSPSVGWTKKFVTMAWTPSVLPQPLQVCAEQIITTEPTTHLRKLVSVIEQCMTTSSPQQTTLSSSCTVTVGVPVEKTYSHNNTIAIKLCINVPIENIWQFHTYWEIWLVSLKRCENCVILIWLAEVKWHLRGCHRNIVQMWFQFWVG